ncbi:MAG: hypothetical protein IKT46_02420 [Clostridia bacterium]|nr:hypothetical protein [Clostridia bacterium]
MKKLIAIILSTALLLCFGACSAVQNAEPIIMETDKDFFNPDIIRKTLSLNSGDLVAVTEDGTLLVPGYFASGSGEYKNAADVASVDVSSNNFAVLYNDGTVDFMTKGIAKPVGSEQIYTEVEAWSDIVDIACTDKTVVGLTRNGQIKVASLDQGWAQMTSGWASVIAIDLDGSCLTALRNDGKVFVCQSLNGKMYNHCPDWEDIISIHTSGNIYGVSDSGKVYCYDPVSKTSSELSGLDSVIKVSGDKDAIIALKSNSSVVCLKDELNDKISDWTGVADIAGNINTVVALSNDGNILYATLKEGGSSSEYVGWSNISVPAK